MIYDSIYAIDKRKIKLSIAEFQGNYAQSLTQLFPSNPKQKLNPYAYAQTKKHTISSSQNLHILTKSTQYCLISITHTTKKLERKQQIRISQPNSNSYPHISTKFKTERGGS